MNTEERNKKVKKAQMEFAWIFAVIVGAMILFLAFYFVGTKLLSQHYEQATVEAHSLDILLNPFSSFGEIKVISQDVIALPQHSALSINCDKIDLGYNEIIITQKGTASIPRIVYDKYIYAEQNLEAKKFQVLSAPLEMPWRVADVIILWPFDKKYCFVSAPQFINETLGNSTDTGLNISSIIFTQNKNLCPQNTTIVCFPGSGCDISVTIHESNNLGRRGSTTKRGQSPVYFAGDALLYASIFSSKDLYYCNFQRLMARLALQTDIYREKANALASKGCSATFNLGTLRQHAESISKASTISESNIAAIWQNAKLIKQQNDAADCKLY